MGILVMVYYNFFGEWNCSTSPTNYNSSSTTFSFSFCYMATWFNCLCKLWVIARFMFVTISITLSWNYFFATNLILKIAICSQVFLPNFEYIV
jgi:hypothetical protein